MRKGDLFWLDLGPVVSSTPAKRRPVVVVQSDEFNRSALRTTVIVAISSNTRLASFPGNVFLPAQVTGLPKDSVANITAIATVDRDDLGERIGTLPGYLMAEIEQGIRLVLDV